MAPKAAPKEAIPQAEANPSALDTAFPPWPADNNLPADKDAGPYQDASFGQCMLPAAQAFVDAWKRPGELSVRGPEVPMLVLDAAGPSAAAPGSLGEAGSRALRGELFAGHDAFEWLSATFVAVRAVQARLPKGSCLWELVHPKGKDGQPALSASGRYHLRCWVMDRWRRVTVDDRIPVDLFGRPLLVGAIPLQLWPLLLSKAILKLMAAFQLLECSSPHQVPAFQWLTGWMPENLLDQLSGVASRGVGVLFDRLEDADGMAARQQARRSITTVTLLCRSAPERRPPRLIVLCGPPAVGTRRLAELLLQRHPDAFGRTVSHTTRMPKEHEVQGQTYTFSDPASMQAEVDAGQFLESCVVQRGTQPPALYGSSLAAVRSVAVSGRLCVMCLDLQGARSLRSNARVDGLFAYIAPASMQELQQCQTDRLREAESTIQKRLQWAAQQTAAAAKPGLFNSVIQRASQDAVMAALREAVSPLSPLVRTRLCGLPAYVLEYSDLVPANTVEKADLKPVLLAGPAVHQLEALAGQLVGEFPDVFMLPRRHLTPPYNSGAAAEGPEESGPDLIVPPHQLEAMAAAGELLVQLADPFSHELARQRRAVTKADAAAVVARGRIPLLLADLATVEAARATGTDLLAVFVAPASPEACEADLREWLREPAESVAAMQAATRAELEQVEREGMFDHILVNTQPEETCRELAAHISRCRPDILPPADSPMETGAGSSAAGSPVASPRKAPAHQPPLVLCCPSDSSQAVLVGRLKDQYKGRMGVPVRHTTKKQEKGEEEGMHFHFVKKDVFQRMVEEGKLLETSEAGATQYGIALANIEQMASQGMMAILELDARRAAAATLPGALKLLVLPPSDIVAQQVRAAAGPKDKEADIQQRIAAAAAELERCRAASAQFASTIPISSLEAAFMSMQQAISAHSPAVVPPPAQPLVLAGPFGPATSKAALLQRLLAQHGEHFVCPRPLATQQPPVGPADLQVISLEEAQRMLAAGEFLLHEEALGQIYGISKASVLALQYEGKVPVLDVDHIAQVLELQDAGQEATCIAISPESAEGMLGRIQAQVAGSMLPGYESDPEEALQRLLQAAEAELRAAQEHAARFQAMLQAGSEPDPAFHRLLEVLSRHYPKQVPSHHVWGFGRPSWDTASRVYGQRPVRIAVLGPALVGKTTHAARLSARLGAQLVSPGALLHAEVQAATALGLRVRELVERSGVVPDELLVELVVTRLQQQDCCAHGWVLDGFPHTAKQAEALLAAECGTPDQVLLLEAPQALLLERARYRRIDSDTGAVYLAAPAGAASAAVMPADAAIAARLKVRHDDSEANVVTRLRQWEAHSQGLQAAFASCSVRINAAGGSDQVLAATQEAVEGAASRLSSELQVVPSQSLSALQYEVAQVAKWRGRLLVQLTQPDRRQAWVELQELAQNAACISVMQDPAAFAHAHQVVRGDLRAFAPCPLLLVDALEPVSLVAALFAAPCCAAGPVDASASPPAAREAQLACEAYSWRRDRPGHCWLRLRAEGAAAARLELPRGRHLLRLLLPSDRLAALELRGHAAFHVAEASKMLADKEGLAVQTAEGRSAMQPAGTWRLWLRHFFAVAEPTLATLDLDTPGEARQRSRRFVLVNNDTAEETSLLARSSRPMLLRPTATGYTVVVMAYSREALPEGPWRLTLISDKPVTGWAEQVSSRLETFDGKYSANKYLSLARYIIAASQRTHLALHAETQSTSGLPVGCRVAALQLTEGGPQWGADAQVLASWTGDAHVQAASLWLPPGKFLLQLALDPGRCRLGFGPDGGLAEEAAWRLQLAPSADPKTCVITADDSKQKYFQAHKTGSGCLVRCSTRATDLQASFSKWNEGQKDRMKQAAAVLEAHKARAAAAASADQQAPAAAAAAAPQLALRPGKGKDAQPQELHPSQFVRVQAAAAAAGAAADAAGAASAADRQQAAAGSSDEQQMQAQEAAGFEGWQQAQAAEKAALEAAGRAQSAEFKCWRQQQAAAQLHLARERGDVVAALRREGLVEQPRVAAA